MQNTLKLLEYKEEILEYINIPTLNEKQWKDFMFTEIFTEIQRGRYLKNADHIAGETPYISSKATNNGIDNFISIVETPPLQRGTVRAGRFTNNNVLIMCVFFRTVPLLLTVVVLELRSIINMNL